MNMNLSSFQMFLVVAVQVWVIVSPIIIIRKLNYLTNLMHAHLETDHESS